MRQSRVPVVPEADDASTSDSDTSRAADADDASTSDSDASRAAEDGTASKKRGLRGRKSTQLQPTQRSAVPACARLCFSNSSKTGMALLRQERKDCNWVIGSLRNIACANGDHHDGELETKYMTRYWQMVANPIYILDGNLVGNYTASIAKVTPSTWTTGCRFMSRTQLGMANHMGQCKCPPIAKHMPKPKPTPPPPPQPKPKLNPTGSCPASTTVLYSVSFVWPRDRDWEAGDADRRPPRWYFECLVDFIRRNSGTRGVDFIVHVHGMAQGLIPTNLLHRVCKHPSTLGIAYCNASLPALWPNARRFAPLIDSPKDCTVIVADIHDTPSLQRNTIHALTHRLHAQGAGMALTFWPIAGDSYFASEIADNSVAPPPSLEPELPEAGAGSDAIARRRWTIDGGLAISTLAARTAILASHGGVTFRQHLRACANTYQWDGAEENGTDEALLQLYLLSFRSRDVPPRRQHTFAKMAEAVRKIALPFVHNLTRRGDDPPRLDLPAPATPRYPPASTQASKQFVYDQEGDFVHAGVAIPLQWAAQTHVPAVSLKTNAAPKKPPQPRAAVHSAGTGAADTDATVPIGASTPAPHGHNKDGSVAKKRGRPKGAARLATVGKSPLASHRAAQSHTSSVSTQPSEASPTTAPYGYNKDGTVTKKRGRKSGSSVAAAIDVDTPSPKRTRGCIEWHDHLVAGGSDLEE